MSELKRVERIESTPFQTHTEQNVQGWERIGSLAGGVIMVGKGLRRGGVFGLIQVAIGGVALARGDSFAERGNDQLAGYSSFFIRPANAANGLCVALAIVGELSEPSPKYC